MYPTNRDLSFYINDILKEMYCKEYWDKIVFIAKEKKEANDNISTVAPKKITIEKYKYFKEKEHSLIIESNKQYQIITEEMIIIENKINKIKLKYAETKVLLNSENQEQVKSILIKLKSETKQLRFLYKQKFLDRKEIKEKNISEIEKIAKMVNEI